MGEICLVQTPDDRCSCRILRAYDPWRETPDEFRDRVARSIRVIRRFGGKSVLVASRDVAYEMSKQLLGTQDPLTNDSTVVFQYS